ncbi:MAG TPA: NAD(P)/FAD-dependent oxidoreductase, partial [Chitinophagaceae bacterium]|nr:NAD(P)/FAD-dependent oxidoreductase [Chitinophagaceae bacterium]
MKQEKKYDIIIVGGSYAGLAAAMALGRALRKVLVIDSGNPCNQQTPHSHNFLTNDGKTPKEIAGIARQQVQQYKTVDFLNGFVSSGRKTETGFVVETETKETYAAKKIVFATGIKDSMPAIPGFAECWGISVLHCPYCHGYEVRHQKTGILANGNDAVELATLISNWTDDLTVYTNGKSTLSEEQVQKLQQQNIHINQNEIEKLEHNKGYVERILFKDGAHATVKAIYARLPFVQHSSVPQMLGCELTPEGYIKIDPAQRTTVPGIFAC